MNDLRKFIDDKNKELVEMYSGSQDALHDPEWAKQEGIPVIELTNFQLEELLLDINIFDLNAEELYNLSLEINKNT